MVVKRRRIATNNIINSVIETITQNGLSLIPLYTTRDGECCCRNTGCSSPGKHPLFRCNWKKVASSDKAKIEDWLSMRSKMNYGVATGRKSPVTGKFLVVVDVDRGDNDEFVSSLPETFTYLTGSGGKHMWYWSDEPVPNSVSLLAHKVDVRGTDGYVVVPPSRHCNGTEYGARTSVEEISRPIAALPPEVVRACNATKLPKRRDKRKRQTPPETLDPANRHQVAVPKQLKVADVRALIAQGSKVPTGCRNVALHRLLSSKRAAGRLIEELVREAEAVVLSSFEDPDSIMQDIPAIVASVAKYPAYNTSYQRVNELYVKWLRKNFPSIATTIDEDKLNKLDIEFFGALRATERPGRAFPSLKDIAAARAVYIRSRGIDRFASYKPQLLAAKLRSLGLERVRTAGGNVWKVALPT